MKKNKSYNLIMLGHVATGFPEKTDKKYTPHCLCHFGRNKLLLCIGYSQN